MFPESKDEEYGQCFIDELLGLAIQYIQKRYGPKLMVGKVIKRTFELIQSTGDQTIETDYTIKQFTLLFIVQHEREFASEIEKHYTDGGLFGNEGKKQFRIFMCKMKEFVEQTLNFAYHKSNIVTTIDNFVMEARKQYIMGPRK